MKHILYRIVWKLEVFAMKDCCGKTSMPAFKLVSKRGFASRERERDHRAHHKRSYWSCDCNSPRATRWCWCPLHRFILVILSPISGVFAGSPVYGSCDHRCSFVHVFPPLLTRYVQKSFLPLLNIVCLKWSSPEFYGLSLLFHFYWLNMIIRLDYHILFSFIFIYMFVKWKSSCLKGSNIP